MEKKFEPKKLRFLRVQAGLSFLGLARKLQVFGDNKISKNSIWGWERGNHEPSLKALNTMSSFFKVPVDFFMKK